MIPTHRVAYSRGLRQFSVSSAKGNSTSSTATAVTASASSTSSLPPWLYRWLHLWDQESGTHEILHLKQTVNQSSLAFDNKQRQVASARTSVDRAIQAFEDSQLQHNQLLQSRDRWSPSQALEFAKLLEKEVQIRKQLESAKKELATLEVEQLQSMNDYMNNLRRRYQEEQLWQDKWRVYSTYGTWGLIVLNSIVFFIGQYMYRLRENQRMKDLEELIEGLVTTVREQKNQNEHERQQQHSTQGVEGIESQKQRDSSEAKDSDDGVMIPLAEEADKDDELDSKEMIESADALASKTRQLSPLHYWSRVVHYVKNASKIVLLPKERQLDLPSAILGASAAGMAWLIATMLSRKGGAQ